MNVQNILQSDPEYIQRQLAQQEMQRLNPQGTAAGAIGAVLGRGLGNVSSGRGFFSIADPALRKVSDVQSIMSEVQFDPNNPEQYYQTVGTTLQQRGYGELAPLAFQQANKLNEQKLDRELRQKQVGLTERQVIVAEQNAQETRYKTNPELLLQEARDLPEDDPRKQTLITRYYKIKQDEQLSAEKTQAEINRINAETDKARAQAKELEGGTTGVAGPVGKAGAFRDIRGQVWGASAMKNFRSEQDALRKMVDTLNDVTLDDVKNAESWIDWTTKNKEIAGKVDSKTLDAQTKIAAAQLLEQINSLPPGSASDADMKAAAKSFPGYGNPKALARWVNETKTKAAKYANELNDNFNFGKPVTATPLIQFKEGPVGRTAPRGGQSGDWKLLD